jgi:hypothetical protein
MPSNPSSPSPSNPPRTPPPGANAADASAISVTHFLWEEFNTSEFVFDERSVSVRSKKYSTMPPKFKELSTNQIDNSHVNISLVFENTDGDIERDEFILEKVYTAHPATSSVQKHAVYCLYYKKPVEGGTTVLIPINPERFTMTDGTPLVINSIDISAMVFTVNNNMKYHIMSGKLTWRTITWD